MGQPQSPVKVYTEWGKLEEVILGSCLNFNLEGIDDIFRFLYDNRDGKFRDRKTPYQLDPKFLVERQEDLDNLQKLLEGFGVTVRRAASLDAVHPIKTPTFESYMTACDSPRDMFLVVGDEVIETPPTNRKRYFEGQLLRDVFMDYFKRGARWTVAPKSTLSEERLDLSYWKDTVDQPINAAAAIDPKYEIAFDAANCLKFGKDIVMNVGTKNHELGAEWLQRHFGDRFRVHAIRMCDSHLDGHFVPIAPGKLLVNEVAMYKQYHRLPPALQKWDRVPILDPATNFEYPTDHLQMASSVGMSVNVLSLDEKRILIRDTATLTIKALERAKFEPIPVRIRHCELFGGGIHCSSVDVRRQESCGDYFS